MMILYKHFSSSSSTLLYQELLCIALFDSSGGRFHRSKVVIIENQFCFHPTKPGVRFDVMSAGSKRNTKALLAPESQIARKEGGRRGRKAKRSSSWWSRKQIIGYHLAEQSGSPLITPTKAPHLISIQNKWQRCIFQKAWSEGKSRVEAAELLRSLASYVRWKKTFKSRPLNRTTIAINFISQIDGRIIVLGKLIQMSPWTFQLNAIDHFTYVFLNSATTNSIISSPWVPKTLLFVVCKYCDFGHKGKWETKPPPHLIH